MLNNKRSESSAIRDGFYYIMAECQNMNHNYETFVLQLAERLPPDAYPYVETQDGSVIDIYWEDRLIITIDVDGVYVGDFSSGEQDFKTFEGFGNEAIDHIVDCYHRINLTPDDFKK